MSKRIMRVIELHGDAPPSSLVHCEWLLVGDLLYMPLRSGLVRIRYVPGNEDAPSRSIRDMSTYLSARMGHLIGGVFVVRNEEEVESTEWFTAEEAARGWIQ
jgi:hypothetical protein